MIIIALPKDSCVGWFSTNASDLIDGEINPILAASELKSLSDPHCHCAIRNRQQALERVLVRVAFGELEERLRLARARFVRPVVEVDYRAVDEPIRKEVEHIDRRAVQIAVHACEGNLRNPVAHGRKRLAEPAFDELDVVEAFEVV